MSKKIWVPKGPSLYLEYRQKEYPSTLAVGVYELTYNDFLGFGLAPISDSFEFPYKIYGLETDIIKRVQKYYKNTDSGNLGILLNGVRGTGKTVTSKIICNQMKLPVILIGTEYKGAEDYINSLNQDLVVFIDEYEKIYKQSHEFLTIMDGALNSIYRRVFLLTTNSLYIDQNLLDRPSRIRYLKTFDNLSPAIVEEIVDDVLVHKQYKDDCIKYISTLEIITVDIVKAIINEVNIQDESPMEFKTVFNASVKKGKYKIFTDEEGKIDLLIKGAKVSPRPNFGEHTIDSGFYINDDYVGRILEVTDMNTIKVEVHEFEVEDDVQEDSDTMNLEILQPKGKGKQKKQNKRATRMATPFDLPKGVVTFAVTEDYSFNDTYKYGKRQFSEEGYGYF